MYSNKLGLHMKHPPRYKARIVRKIEEVTHQDLELLAVPFVSKHLTHL